MSADKQSELTHAPPLSLAAALLTWGWQTEHLAYAVIMAVLLELPHWLGWRCNLSDRDFEQLADLSSLVFAAVIVYIFITYSAHGIFKILELMPFILFLLILSQRYSRQGKIKPSALFISMRKLDKSALAEYPYSIDISLPYLFICLLAAATGHKQQSLFFIILCCFFVLFLAHVRPRHYHPLRWFLPLLLVFVSAFFIQSGLKTMQAIMEQNVALWFDRFSWRSRDINRTTTAIGALGRLKLSDRVALRVKSEQPLPSPFLLHEASYNSYQYGIWSGTHTNFEVVDKDPQQSNWTIAQDGGAHSRLTAALYFDENFAILPVPYGASTIAGNDVLTVARSRFNSIKVESKPGWINYHVDYSEGDVFGTEPVPADLAVPDNYRDDFKRLAASLDLYDSPPREIVNTVNSFFAEEFYYSLTQNQRYPKGRYLTNFLFKDRKGHCEYFATATTLLLRTAGVPARYAVGFSAHEYSQWQEMYLLRSRDAHSWTTYYLDGKWHILDTTPSVWASMEAQDRSLLEGLFDLASWLSYTLGRDDSIDEEQNNYNRLLLLLLIPLILLLLRKLGSRTAAAAKPAAGSGADGNHRRPVDPAFFKFISGLEQTLSKRNPGETLARWLVRILSGSDRLNEHLKVIQLHYRHRFGAATGDRARKERDKTIEQIQGGTTDTGA